MCVLQEPSSDTSQSSPFFLQFLANITTLMDAPILCTLFLIYQPSNTSQCPHLQAQTLLCPLSTPLVPLQPQDSVHASCRSLPAPDPPSSSLDEGAWFSPRTLASPCNTSRIFTSPHRTTGFLQAAADGLQRVPRVGALTDLNGNQQNNWTGAHRQMTGQPGRDGPTLGATVYLLNSERVVNCVLPHLQNRLMIRTFPSWGWVGI